MSEKYLCASCGQLFPTGDAVDGFTQGYRKGFLCPFCHANLEEAGESDDIVHLRFGLAYMIALAVVVWLGQIDSFQLQIGKQGLINEILTVGVLAAVPTVPFLILNRKAVWGSRTVFTRNIPHP
ncbi:hypothetical protein [Marinobacter mobilis]|uniref:Cxxc_20_cxxc protein n=1 Tax=Marinobacter mobilis TaxID=488533 RepID=A0A1H2T3I7_9GAMM|nr:hypothetical protein [Marinobacter mobilis]SDW38431.1 hypothetical protein SAMN04487960_102327 [Marinobacter mobilis]